MVVLKLKNIASIRQWFVRDLVFIECQKVFDKVGRTKSTDKF